MLCWLHLQLMPLLLLILKHCVPEQDFDAAEIFSGKDSFKICKGFSLELSE